MYTTQAPTTCISRRVAGALVGAILCLAIHGAATVSWAAQSPAAGQQAASTMDEAKVLERIRQIGMKLKAPCCPDMTVAQHDSPETIKIKKEIRQMLLAGKSEGEIIDAMKAKYGEAILAESPLGGWKLWSIVGGSVALLALLILMGRWMMTHERALTALHVAGEAEEEKPGTRAA